MWCGVGGLLLVVGLFRKERCRVRMWQWCELALQTVRAEFPHFEVLANFGPFSLEGDLVDAGPAKKSLGVLARFFGISFEALWSQYEHVAHVALQKRRGGSRVPTLAAWRLALEHCKASWKHGGHVQDCEPFQELETVLVRFAAWSGTTSGVEHTFSITQWALQGRRTWVSSPLEVDELKLLVDKTPRKSRRCFVLRAAYGSACALAVPGAAPRIASTRAASATPTSCPRLLGLRSAGELWGALHLRMLAEG